MQATQRCFARAADPFGFLGELGLDFAHLGEAERRARAGRVVPYSDGSATVTRSAATMNAAMTVALASWPKTADHQWQVLGS
ncbi:hypothetical protein T190_28840 [Sinorhizobium meliloti CCBAU 01290]|nr:hypothetical protein T190_28840 [Sinorhizobium meliloti CCBAU 01290]